MKRLIIYFDIDYIYSNHLMLNLQVLLTLAFKKMLCDILRKMGNPVSPASALRTNVKR